MKIILALFFCSFAIQAFTDDRFLPSSENFDRDTSEFLKNQNAFIFFFFLKVESKETESIIKFFNQELAKEGQVVKKEIFKENGLDLSFFDYPTLQFSIQQLVDYQGKALPVLQARLAINSLIENPKNKQLFSTNVNQWIIYLQDKKEDLNRALRQSFPLLLKKFSEDYQKANPDSAKPTFFIFYDSSWFKKIEN